jgi:polar amino acid transport system ATP-binding protein
VSDAILAVRDLRKSFAHLEVLRGVTFEVRFGEVIVIIGPSGSGKSTLLRCLNQIEMPTAGEVVFRDTPLFQGGPVRGRKAADVRGRLLKIGMVFQQFNLFPHMTVLQNVVEAPISVLRATRRDAEARARELLNRVGLAEKIHALPGTLSGGQQQRVAIVRALAMEPELMLFDEPTSALDTEMVGEVLAVMRDLARNGTTMIVVTHEIDFARTAASRVLVLDQGRILEEGPPGEVLVRPRHEQVRHFLRRVLHEEAGGPS